MREARLQEEVIAETSAHPRSFGALWPFLKYSFIAYIFSELLLTASNASAFIGLKRAFDGGEISVAEATFIDVHQAFANLAYLLIFIACVVAYCRFYYRATKNLESIQAADLQTTPFWSVGYFFVPIATLWKPLGAVRQIWRGSFDPATADVKVPAMIGWWWFFWLVTGLLGQISFRLMIKSGGLKEEIVNFDAYLGSLTLDMISAPFAIAAAIFVLRFTKQIKAAQERNVLVSKYLQRHETFVPA